MKNFTYLCVTLFWCVTMYAQSDTNVQRVRIDFKTSEGYIRHLLLGFTQDNSATDGIDYGYDARNREFLADDLNWMIDSKRYIIQGVGSYHASKQYPLGMFISNTGEVEITLTDLENFDKPIEIYIYDAFKNTHHLLNKASLKLAMAPGAYENRFFMTFSNMAPQNLSVDKSELDHVTIKYIKNTKSLNVNTYGKALDLQLYDLQGRFISTHHLTESSNVQQVPFSHVQNQVILTVLKSENTSSIKRVLIN